MRMNINQLHLVTFAKQNHNCEIVYLGLYKTKGDGNHMFEEIVVNNKSYKYLYLNRLQKGAND